MDIYWVEKLQRFLSFVFKIIEKYLNATGRQGLTLVDVWEVDRYAEVNSIA